MICYRVKDYYFHKLTEFSKTLFSDIKNVLKLKTFVRTTSTPFTLKHHFLFSFQHQLLFSPYHQNIRQHTWFGESPSLIPLYVLSRPRQVRLRLTHILISDTSHLPCTAITHSNLTLQKYMQILRINKLCMAPSTHRYLPR